MSGSDDIRTESVTSLSRSDAACRRSDKPHAEAVDPETTGSSRIVELSPTGTLLATWGAPGNGPGQIGLPAGIAVDAGGNVYVAEGDRENGTPCNCRVQNFSPAGQLLAVWR